eukprot:gene14775-biopygen11863
MPNWKSPGPDGVQGYWIKNLTALHERIAVQMNDLLVNGKEVPKWLTTGKTALCQKDPSKGSAVDNYRPISCLPLMWKLMTGNVNIKRGIFQGDSLSPLLFVICMIPLSGILRKVEPLLRTVKRQGTIKTDDAMEPKEYKNVRKRESIMPGRKKECMDSTTRYGWEGFQNSWKWLQSSDLKGCTEALSCSAQEQALRTNNIKHFIDKVGSLLSAGWDARVVETEREEIDNYRPLRDEIARLWSMRKVEIIPVVVGALGAVSKQFEAYVEAIGIKMNVEHAQKTALLGSARILRLVLGQ